MQEMEIHRELGLNVFCGIVVDNRLFEYTNIASEVLKCDFFICLTFI